MNRENFLKIMDECGDALVYIKGPVSKKVKYNTVTANLDNKYIQRRAGNRAPVVMEGRVLTFAWDQDDFRQIDPKDVVKVIPLSEVINGNRNGRG